MNLFEKVYNIISNLVNKTNQQDKCNCKNCPHYSADKRWQCKKHQKKYGVNNVNNK